MVYKPGLIAPGQHFDRVDWDNQPILILKVNERLFV